MRSQVKKKKNPQIYPKSIYLNFKFVILGARLDRHKKKKKTHSIVIPKLIIGDEY